MIPQGKVIYLYVYTSWSLIIQKILRSEPELWGCTSFQAQLFPKMTQLNWTRILFEKAIEILPCTSWAFPELTLKKTLEQVQSYEDVPFFGCKLGPKKKVGAPQFATFVAVWTTFVALWCSGYHYCTTSFNKAWTQVLCRFKSCSWHAEDSRWWVSLMMVTAGNKAKYLLSVNHTTKTIHLRSCSHSSL